MTIEILIPYYGDVEYLRQAVMSVVGQENPDWRLTVVDDGYPSTGPEAFVKGLGDKRIKYVRNPQNLGVTGNFNKCVELAEAEHVVALGFDDRLKPNFIDVANDLINAHPEAQIFQVGVEVIDSQGDISRPLPDRIKSLIRPKTTGPALMDSEEALDSLMLGNWLYFPSIVWKRDALQRFGFDDQYTVVQDLDLISKILLDGGKLAHGPEVAFQYRRHPESMSSKSGGNAHRYKEEKNLFEKLQPQFKAAGFALAEKRARRRLLSRLAALVDALKLLVSGRTKGLGKLLKIALGR